MKASEVAFLLSLLLWFCWRICSRRWKPSVSRLVGWLYACTLGSHRSASLEAIFEIILGWMMVVRHAYFAKLLRCVDDWLGVYILRENRGA